MARLSEPLVTSSHSCPDPVTGGLDASLAPVTTRDDEPEEVRS